MTENTTDSIVPISVVIPCFRNQDTIERAVISVAEQLSSPIEIIIVDDASDDKTPIILKKLQTQLGSDWIIIISLTSNKGPAVARNIGWARTTQPYIAFLDADDSWHPCKLMIQYQYMHAHPDVAITAHKRVRLYKSTTTSLTITSVNSRPISCCSLLLSNYFPTSTVMLKRDLPLRFQPFKRHAEDYLLWLQIVCSGYSADILDAPLAYTYKEFYGESGLSGQLWLMEKGEIDVYHRLYQHGFLSRITVMLFYTWSLIKFIIRCVLLLIRGNRKCHP